MWTLTSLVLFSLPLYLLADLEMSADSFGAGGSDAQQSLQTFWPRVMEEIRNLTVVWVSPSFFFLFALFSLRYSTKTNCCQVSQLCSSSTWVYSCSLIGIINVFASSLLMHSRTVSEGFPCARASSCSHQENYETGWGCEGKSRRAESTQSELMAAHFLSLILEKAAA